MDDDFDMRFAAYLFELAFRQYKQLERYKKERSEFWKALSIISETTEIKDAQKIALRAMEYEAP